MLLERYLSTALVCVANVPKGCLKCIKKLILFYRSTILGLNSAYTIGGFIFANIPETNGPVLRTGCQDERVLAVRKGSKGNTANPVFVT
jgi:hypothetical protein